MKADIDGGFLVITPESITENYALKLWQEDNVNAELPDGMKRAKLKFEPIEFRDAKQTKTN